MRRLTMASYDLGDLFKKAEAGLKEVPTGQYNAEIVGGRVTDTSTGKTRVIIDHRIVSGPQAGATVPQSQVISPESEIAMKMFFLAFRKLNVPDSAFKTGVKLEQIIDTLKGKPTAITVEVDDYGAKVKTAVIRD
jgi:hypothetical protein